eukprot:15310160-Alexandrium_andersonii.AAC.2
MWPRATHTGKRERGVEAVTLGGDQDPLALPRSKAAWEKEAAGKHEEAAELRAQLLTRGARSTDWEILPGENLAQAATTPVSPPAGVGAATPAPRGSAHLGPAARGGAEGQSPAGACRKRGAGDEGEDWADPAGTAQKRAEEGRALAPEG